MTPTELLKRLHDALMRQNQTASLQLSVGALYVSDLSIDVVNDRVIIGPRVATLTSEALRALADPDSSLWCVARFDDPDFAGRVSRFLKRRGVNLPPDWLSG
jgi:hypothetical protein